MSKVYYDEKNRINTEKLREVLAELPPFATEFFVGVSTSTAPLTRLNYAYDVRIFFDYLVKVIHKNSITIDEIALADLEKLKAYNIEQYMDYLSSYTFNDQQLSCGERGKERKICSLRSFFKYYFNKDKLTANVTAKVTLPKRHVKEIIRLDNAEVSDILHLAENGTELTKKQSDFHDILKLRDTAILTLFLGTGIRISECIGLDIEDFDFANNSFTVTRKGGDRSILYFSDEVRTAVLNYLDWLDDQKESSTDFGCNIKDHKALFISMQGKRISVRAMQNLVNKYSQIVSPLKRITPHKLRSTYGTALYRQTQDIYVVADVLGHKDVNTTKKHYASMSEDIRKKASNAVKLRKD